MPLPNSLCLRITFPLAMDGHSQTYDFLFHYLSPLLKSLQITEVDFKLERNESLRDIVENSNLNELKIRKVFTDFCRNHGVAQEKSLYSAKEKTFIHARILTKDLARVLDSYNILFEIFWNSLIVFAPNLILDLTDVGSNQVLVIGFPETLNAFQVKVSALISFPLQFEFIQLPADKKYY